MTDKKPRLRQYPVSKRECLTPIVLIAVVLFEASSPDDLLECEVGVNLRFHRLAS